MLINYIRLAWRNLAKHRFFSLINAVGLTVSLASCLLMALFIRHELSFDRFQVNGDRTVRMIMGYSMGEGGTTEGDFTSAKVLPRFKEAFPEVESGTRIAKASPVIRLDEKLFEEPRFLYVDSSFFAVFPSFNLQRGEPAQVLNGPKKMVITASTAKRYFGQEDPVGKQLIVGSLALPFEITGVVEDCPENSQIQFDFLASFASLAPYQDQTYWNANYTTYLLLRRPSDIAGLQQKIPAFMDRETADYGGAKIRFTLEPYQKVHLYSAYDAIVPNSNIRYVYIVSAIALLLLLIACFTYVNLSTAKAMDRAREVGIRKVSGASRPQLFWQFIGESGVLVLLSMVAAVILAGFSLPYFNQLSGRNIASGALLEPVFLAQLFLAVLLISFLAGSYPAMILSGYQPVRVLKGRFSQSGEGQWLRKSLLVFQFAIAIFLVVATLVINQQMRFIRGKELGFDREHVVSMKADRIINEKAEAVKSTLGNVTGVKAVSMAYETPVHIRGGYSMRRADMPSGKDMIVMANPVDENYLAVHGLRVLAGTPFTRQDVEDVRRVEGKEAYTYKFILNESAARDLGWTPQQAIGQKMFLGDDRPGEVKAVIQDFHFESLREPVSGLVLFPDTWANMVMVKLDGRSLSATLAGMKSAWQSLAPHRPFDPHFLDEQFESLYQSETRMSKVLTSFSLIAILLSCLGLIGLSTYAVQQRIREIGIRKVMGASVQGLIGLLSTSFLKLIGLAFLIAAPLGAWIMHRWLQDFSYRIDLRWWMFAIAALIVLAAALTSIGWQVIRAVRANPVKSLRSE
jgi:putative ABC transport system permease protein